MVGQRREREGPLKEACKAGRERRGWEAQAKRVRDVAVPWATYGARGLAMETETVGEALRWTAEGGSWW